MVNYWVVGTNWAGDDQAERFYSLGKWEVGWDDCDIPEEYEAKIKHKAVGKENSRKTKAMVRGQKI